MRAETVETISAWAVATFGNGATDKSVCARAGVELAELAAELHSPNGARPDRIAAECADVYIVLARLASRREVDDRTLTQWMGEEQFWQGKRHDLGPLCAEAHYWLYALMNGYDTKRGLTGCLARVARICTLMERDLWAEVDAKMVINRARKWALDGAGHGQHVKE